MYKLDITHPWAPWVINLRDAVCNEFKDIPMDDVSAEQFTQTLCSVVESFNGRLVLFDQNDDGDEYILFDTEEDATLFKLKFL